MKNILVILVIAHFSVFVSCAQEKTLQTIKLPQPQMTGGKPLMEALKNRKSDRKFSDQKLELQMLSNLLWAADGINRTESGKRTAPSAMNWQETDIYVSLPDGSYKYNAKDNSLEPVAAGNQRAKMGKLDYVKDASLVLTYVADYSKVSGTDKENKDFYTAVDAGFISQNVYLFCASEGLATVVMGSVDRDQIKSVLKLSNDQKVILSQCVGFPAK